MKKAFVIAVKAVFGVEKVVLAILGVLVLAVVGYRVRPDCRSKLPQ